MTIKNDEKQLWWEFLKNREAFDIHNIDLETAGNIARRLHIPEKRSSYIFKKWTEKGLYDYGLTPDLGWLTEFGRGIELKFRVIPENAGSPAP